MTPTKKTVYVPVNGEQEKVVCNDYPDWLDTITGVIEQEGYFFTPEQLNEYTEKVIKDALATAADKRTLKVVKESITNTFDETFNKFKL